MKRTKFIISLLLISLIFIMNIFYVFSYDKFILPYYIKIGLFFDKTAKSVLLLESNTAFSVGIFNEDEFINLFDLNENRILLRKDKFYINKELDFKRYGDNTNDFNSSSDAKDVYYVQIGQNFVNYDKACSFLNSLEIQGIDSYLYYGDDWRVYAGPYKNGSEASKIAENVNRIYHHETNVIKPSNSRVQVIDEKNNIIFIYDSCYEIYFVGKKNGNNVPLVNVEGTDYRGGITAKRLTNSDMTIINKLPLEEYLYGVIPSEMPASWPVEALKAQAIAARGFAVTNFNKYKRFDFNLCTTTYSQVYKGYSGEHPNTNKAVDQTRDMVIFYNGKLVEPYYHSNSGGYTEDSENVWTTRLPYIRGIKDDFSLGAPYSTWSAQFTKEEIKNCLAKNNIFVGDILDIKTPSISKNGRVLSLVVYGTEGEATLEKEKSRLVFGLRSGLFTVNSNNNNNIDSDNYTKLTVLSGKNSKTQLTNLQDKYMINNDGVYKIKNIEEVSIYNGKQYRYINKKGSAEGPIGQPVSPDMFIFDGKGYGHGLGMSQYGAKRMAELGYKCDEILAYYYTGVKVE